MSSINKYEILNGSELKKLFLNSECGLLEDIHGPANGKVLFPIWFKKLDLWRGKIFHFSHQNGLTGMNRLGVLNAEILRYRFKGSIKKSLFFDKDVIVIDHNLEFNPNWVRRYHDELVKLDDQIYLGMSYYKKSKGLEFVSYFILDFSKL